MIWDDIGFLLSKNKYNENSLIVEVFTKKHGKVSGIIFGGTSKKIRNYLQIGNLIYVNFNSKIENKIGFFKTEIQKAYSPLYFDNSKKLSCLSSAMNLVKILTADSQSNKNIYEHLEKFYILLESDNWIKNYIFWELKLLKILGYDLELKKLVNEKIIDDKKIYVPKSVSEIKVVPNFLIEDNNNDENLINLLAGLKLVGNYLEKTILKPNNLNLPQSRVLFINSLQ
tara:strand:+ start:3337 stop:4017 length:681 start_codon:yes stop_codon:yes gene_type:complete